MKNFLSVLFVLMIFSTITFSQSSEEPLYFNAYKLVVREFATGNEEVRNTDLTLKLSNTSLECTTCKSELHWELTSNAYKITESKFYADAYDTKLKLKCRVWMKVTSTHSALIGIEYGKIGVLYYTELITNK